MKRYLLDTNALSDFINHRGLVPERVREARQRGDRIGTCEPVIAEMYFGVEFSSTRDENIRRLGHALSQISSWPFDRAAAQEYGRIAADLRRRGRPMQTIDMMIAAIAFALGKTTVVTKDTDLSAIPGLTIENWAAVK